jgi:type VI secretion system secreted protein VgrG
LKKVGYTLLLADGSKVQGVTDEQGRTQRVVTDAPQAITEATLEPKALQACCTAHAEQASGATEPLSFKVADVKTNPDDVGTSVKQVKTPEGEARSLTAGEIAMARLLFKDSIDYTKVKVHNGEYLWFGLQPDDTAMTPNGEMYFNPTRFKEDFARADYADRLWFMHEMVHVWQYQLGYPVKMRGAIRMGLSYKYTLEPGKRLSDYNMEAQGNVLSDYWALRQYGGNPPDLWESKHLNDLPLYETVLKDFIIDPTDRSNLPGGR